MKLSIKKQVKWVKWTAAFALSASLIAGCTGNTTTPTASPTTGSSTVSPTAGQTPGPEPLTITYWVELNPSAARSLRSYSESQLYQELEERTGVTVEFEHPAQGSVAEQFNLLIASGSYPDVIEYDFISYSGGPQSAISDRVIIPLDDLVDQHAPNFKAYLEENPDMRKDLVTFDGNLYVFPSMGVGNTNVSQGYYFRADWLEQLDLDAPETIDEWTEVLRAFKNELGLQTPYTAILSEFNSEGFNGAYGVGVGFYQDNGTVKYGPAEPAFKDYLVQLNSWYEEGLIDPDFSTQDNNSKTSKAINGEAGAFKGGIGGNMGAYLSATRESNPQYDLVAAQHPVLNKGDEPILFAAAHNYRGQSSAAITTANQNPERTAEWLDYLFSEEGHILKSFGVEGITFNWEGDFPRYTDLILNNPDGLSIGDAMSKYLRVAAPSPGFVGDSYYTEQYYEYQQQKDAVVILNQYYDNLADVRLPRLPSTLEESTEFTTIMAEINTYRSEMFLRFVMGGDSLDNFDSYVEQLNRMGIERAIQLQQAALDRYNAQ